MAFVTKPPILIALVNDYDVVTRGLATMLDEYRGRVLIAEIDHNLGVDDQVDIVLYDTFAQPESDVDELSTLVANPRTKHVMQDWARPEDKGVETPTKTVPSGNVPTTPPRIATESGDASIASAGIRTCTRFAISPAANRRFDRPRGKLVTTTFETLARMSLGSADRSAICASRTIRPETSADENASGRRSAGIAPDISTAAAEIEKGPTTRYRLRPLAMDIS